MKHIDITAVPDSYRKAAGKEYRGTVSEVSYRVGNYINPLRQLVTNRNVNPEEAGRETVPGEAIIKKCNVYLPAGYEEGDKDTGYNVLYLLHGVGGNRFEWLNGSGNADGGFVLCNLFDNLIANGEIEPLIVVFPDDRSAHDWTDCSFNSAGTNMLGFYYFDYELRYDLIPFIESTYNTCADISDTSPGGIAYNRMHRAIAGLSMGGMQSLNLTLGGYRCDSMEYTGTKGTWGNGLDTTVTTPGMLDLFAYVGAFSNAPTSSDGKVLRAGIEASSHRLELLYLACGDADDIAYRMGYLRSVEGLGDVAGNNLGDYYQVIVKDGVHDFQVWDNGAYNFARLIFRKTEAGRSRSDVRMTIE